MNESGGGYAGHVVHGSEVWYIMHCAGASCTRTAWPTAGTDARPESCDITKVTAHVVAPRRSNRIAVAVRPQTHGMIMHVAHVAQHVRSARHSGDQVFLEMQLLPTQTQILVLVQRPGHTAARNEAFLASLESKEYLSVQWLRQRPSLFTWRPHDVAVWAVGAARGDIPECRRRIES